MFLFTEPFCESEQMVRKMAGQYEWRETKFISMFTIRYTYDYKMLI